jgi:Putative lumazine-binding
MNHSQQQAITATVMNYAQGWYAGDTARMANALHPDLAKRAWLKNADGEFAMSEYPAQKLIERVSRNTFDTYALANKRADVEILNVIGHMASVVLHMDQWTDLMHVLQIDGEWKIINILWEPSAV